MYNFGDEMRDNERFLVADTRTVLERTEELGSPMNPLSKLVSRQSDDYGEEGDLFTGSRDVRMEGRSSKSSHWSQESWLGCPFDELPDAEDFLVDLGFGEGPYSYIIEVSVSCTYAWPDSFVVVL